MLTKRSVLNLIGYITVFSAGILSGILLQIYIPEENVNERTVIGNAEAYEEIKKETLPLEVSSRAYYLKIEDNTVKQYFRDENNVLVYEKDLSYIDVNSIDTEFTSLLYKGMMFADSVALAEFIENLDS